MKLKKQIILFCLIGAIQIPLNNLIAQGIQMKPTRQSSLEAFSQGNYEKAYSEFRELLLTYTKDPLYKYYSGVCLVNLNKDPREATILLKEAVQGAGTVKTLPSDALFYLSRAQQMSGRFAEATESFNLYTDLVGKKVSKEMGVPEFLQQCSQKKGQVADSEIIPVESPGNIRPDSSKTEKRPVIKEPVINTATKEANPKANLPADYEKILSEAIEFQIKADSLSSLANDQKKAIDKLSGNEKSALKVKILDNEKLAATFQISADQKYREAQAVLNPRKDEITVVEELPLQNTRKTLIDTGKKADNPVVKTVDKKSETRKAVVPSAIPKMEIYSLFEVLAQPATDPRAKLIMDTEVPPGLVYRIQIGVFRNPVTSAFFKGLSPVYGFKISGTDKTIYYVGAFRKSSDAGKALTTVKAKGFKDSFIVALSANKAVSPDRATLLEKEWSSKPLVSVETILPGNQIDTITPTLTFRVEVIRSVKPLKEDMIEGIRKLAGNRGLDVVTLDDGRLDYLVGKFITFDTAEEYTDLLIKNGYRDAKVVAWLGKKEIPIETAKQLFDNLK